MPQHTNAVLVGAVLRAALAPLAAAIVVALCLSPSVVLAHAPIYLNTDATSPDTAAPLGDPSSAGLVYGNLQPWSAQYVGFDIAAGQPFHAVVLRSLRGDDANPALAIVGPGLGDPSGAPFAVPDGDGVLYVSPPDHQLAIFLPDLGLRFFAAAAFDGPLPQDGSYFLVMYSADGTWGSYTVGTGYGP